MAKDADPFITLGFKRSEPQGSIHTALIFPTVWRVPVATPRVHIYPSKAGALSQKKKNAKPHLAPMKLEIWGSKEEAAALRLHQHDFKV